jgi:hypothetical protein
MDKGLGRILRQTRIPVVTRPKPGPLQVRLPYDQTNRAWLREGHRSKPHWIKSDNGDFWSAPASWFNELTRRLVSRFGAVYIIQPHNELEKCAPACWSAKGLECSCSCMGEHHGEGEPSGRWYVVDETYAFSWQGRSWRWTLLRMRE